MSSASSKPIVPSAMPDWLPQGKTNLRDPAASGPFDLLLQTIQTLPKCGTPSLPREGPDMKNQSDAPASGSEDHKPDDPPPEASAANAEPPGRPASTDQPAAEVDAGKEEDDVSPPDPSEAGEDALPDAATQSLVGVASAAAAVVAVDEQPPAQGEALLAADNQQTVLELSDPAVIVAPSSSLPTVESADQPTLTALVPPSGAAQIQVGKVSPLSKPGTVKVTPDVKSQENTIDSTDTPAEPTPLETEPEIKPVDSELSQEQGDSESEPRAGLETNDVRHDSATVVEASSHAIAEPAELAPPTDALSQAMSTSRDAGPSPAAANPTTGVPAQSPQVRLPSDVLAPPSEAARSSATSDVDSARLLNRVARAFAVAAERGGDVTLRLSPPELGSLRLEVQVREGALVARVEAETMDAQTAILDGLAALRDRLADQGVRIERFDVDLMNRQPGGTPERSFQERRETPAPWRAAAPVPPDEEGKTPRPAPHASLSPGRLNVIV